jgi:hypothetical protein
MTRNEVIGQAVDQCLKELYSLVTPSISWNDFIEENKKYNEQSELWKHYTDTFTNRDKNPELWLQYKSTFPDWENKSMNECIGPKPFEFYYLPKEIMKDICDSYIYAYKLDEQQELLNIIEILKNYCQEPIIEKYIEGKNGEPGYRGYEHPNNLEKELRKIFDDKILPDICKQYNKQYNLQTTGIESSVSKAYSQIFQNKFFKFLDMAGNFYNWNRDLNSFNMSVYLGASPNSNKEAVIKNWKEYRNQDIEIDEEQIKKEYYGEEELD